MPLATSLAELINKQQLMHQQAIYGRPAGYATKAKLGKLPDYSQVAIPPYQEGFDRLIIVPKRITAKQIFDCCYPFFRSTYITYSDPRFDEQSGLTNERDPKKGPYAIWVHDSQEPGDDFQNMSAEEIRKAGIATETMSEYLLHLLSYFLDTGQELDTRRLTFCTGSYRYPFHPADTTWFPYIRKRHDFRTWEVSWYSVETRLPKYGGIRRVIATPEAK